MTTTPIVRLARESDLPSILALQKSESNRLGFLPSIALREYIALGLAYTAVTRRASVVAYILGRPKLKPQPWVRPIIQLCVDKEHRRQGIATLLVLRWTTETSRAGQDCVQAWTRVDLAAGRLWNALGFVPVGERRPKTARAKSAVLWRFPLTSEGQRRIRELPERGGYQAARQESQQLLPWPVDRKMDAHGQWWDVGPVPEPLLIDE